MAIIYSDFAAVQDMALLKSNCRFCGFALKWVPIFAAPISHFRETNAINFRGSGTASPRTITYLHALFQADG